MDDELILAAMLKIRQYLDAHPESADTVDGVHFTWIQSQELKHITQAALDLLLEAGAIECVQYGRAQALWRLPRQKNTDTD